MKHIFSLFAIKWMGGSKLEVWISRVLRLLGLRAGKNIKKTKVAFVDNTRSQQVLSKVDRTQGCHNQWRSSYVEWDHNVNKDVPIIDVLGSRRWYAVKPLSLLMNTSKFWKAGMSVHRVFGKSWWSHYWFCGNETRQDATTELSRDVLGNCK